jgi:hypothetical protein
MTTRAAPPHCAREWEVEAIRDGRLRGRDADSARRHLKACATCTLEHGGIENLGADLRRLPRPHLDALAGRRIRQRLLTDHNRWMLHDSKPRAARRPGIVLIAACLSLIAALVVFLRSRPTTEVGQVADEGPNVEVLTAVNARWRREASAHDVRIVLDDGELRLKIERHRSTDRVTIVLPDGEIDDLGTVLSVVAAGDHAQEVQVEQGSVVLRLHGEVPRTLAAGQSWHRTPPQEARNDAAPALPASSAAHDPTARPVQHRSHAGANGMAHGGTKAPETGGVGLDALPSPAQAQAEKAEDEAYLRVVALLSAGRADEARKAAKDYLLRFPNGFRRVEVLNVATPSAP